MQGWSKFSATILMAYLSTLSKRRLFFLELDIRGLKFDMRYLWLYNYITLFVNYELSLPGLKFCTMRLVASPGAVIFLR